MSLEAKSDSAPQVEVRTPSHITQKSSCSSRTVLTGVSQACHRRVTGMSQVCHRRVTGVSQVCHRHVTGISDHRHPSLAHTHIQEPRKWVHEEAPDGC